MPTLINAPPVGFYHYPRTGASAQTSFSLAGGFVAISGLTPTFDIFDLLGAMGVRIIIVGEGADISDNDGCDFKVWCVRKTYAADGSVSGLHLELYGFGTATFSAAASVGGATAAATSRVADTIAFTLTLEGSGTYRGPGTLIESCYGSGGNQDYNHPTANTEPAQVIIPHLGWCDGLIVEFDQTTGAPDGMAALIART